MVTATDRELACASGDHAFIGTGLKGERVCRHCALVQKVPSREPAVVTYTGIVLSAQAAKMLLVNRNVVTVLSPPIPRPGEGVPEEMVPRRLWEVALSHPPGQTIAVMTPDPTADPDDAPEMHVALRHVLDPPFEGEVPATPGIVALWQPCPAIDCGRELVSTPFSRTAGGPKRQAPGILWMTCPAGHRVRVEVQQTVVTAISGPLMVPVTPCTNPRPHPPHAETGDGRLRLPFNCPGVVK